MMIYKGYIGVAYVDDDADVIRGNVVNTRDTITFQGKTVSAARRAFRESVDDYLAFCASLGEPPEKPFSGKFLVRLSPQLHRELTAVAQAKGVSVNKLVTRQLARMARMNDTATATKTAKTSVVHKLPAVRKSAAEKAPTAQKSKAVAK